MNLTMVHVSPQFHVRFDDEFLTTMKESGNPAADGSIWQHLTEFKLAPGKKLPMTPEKNYTQTVKYKKQVQWEEQHLGDSSHEYPVKSIANDRPLRNTTPIQRLTYDESHEQSVISMMMSLDEEDDHLSKPHSINEIIQFIHIIIVKTFHFI